VGLEPRSSSSGFINIVVGKFILSYFMEEMQNLDTIMIIIKMKEITSKTNTLIIYFNDYYGVKAVINAGDKSCLKTK
jgi:hypothetical protein